MNKRIAVIPKLPSSLITLGIAHRLISLWRPWSQGTISNQSLGLAAFIGSMTLHTIFTGYGQKTTPPPAENKAPWLTQAIRKNTLFSELCTPKQQLHTVVLACKNADFENPIFAEKDLDLWLTQATQQGLFQNNDHLLDAWQLFTWLQQFSDKQSLHKDLNNTKKTIPQNPILFSSSDLEDLLQKAIQRLIDRGHCPTPAQIETSRKTLQSLSIGQAFGLPFPTKIPKEMDYTHMVDSLLGVSPFLLPPTDLNPFCIALSQSISSALGYLIAEKAQWEGVPVFGKLNDDTVIDLHRQGRHPCNVHSTRINSNTTHVHKAYIGPFIGFIHDQYHTTTSLFLSSEQQRFLFDRLIPKLETLNASYPALRQRLTTTIHELSHLVLNENADKPRQPRLFQKITDFFQLLLRLYDDSGGNAPMGTQEDRYYVAMSRWLQQTPIGASLPSIENPHRTPAINALLKWIIACGLSTETTLSQDMRKDGYRCITNAEKHLPYDGFSFRDDDSPLMIYNRFVTPDYNYV
jgi:hypothetical protein